MKDFLTAQEVEILQEAHKSATSRKAADRIKTVLLLHKGYSFGEVAKILLLDDSTIRRYILTYKQGGVDGLLESHYHGSTKRLTTEQEATLTQHLKEKTYTKVSKIIAYVEKTFGETYSLEGMTKVLHRLGFSYKKLQIIPGKLDAEKQEIWKEQYEKIKAEKKPEDKIYFGDGCHPQHNTIASRGWIYTKEEKVIKSNTARKRVNLNGAVNIADMEITVLQEETINAQSMIRLVEKLEERQKEGKIYLILDNAPYNHAKIFREYVESRKRVTILYLPAYSPNLNVIERLWKFFKEEMLYGKYYETYQEFVAVVMNFFKNIEEYKQQLSTRLTDNFQTFAI